MGRGSVGLLLVLMVACRVLEGQNARSARPNDPEAPWVQLFDGKSLNGWKKIGQEKWVVEDGAIYGEGITGKYGYLATEKTYKDFHLSLRFKCEASGNSGVFFHTRFEGEPPRLRGIQIEIDPRIGRHTGGLHGDARSWIAWPAPENETVIRPYDWNELLIQVVGNRIRSRLNGVIMIDFTYPSPVNTDGVIALQLHSGSEGKMRFKDIWIRNLTVDNRAPAVVE